MRPTNRFKALLAAAAFVSVTTGCEVVNPGPVADEYMTLPAAQQGFVNGSLQRLTRAVGNTTYSSAALAAREIFPGGQTGSYGFSASQQAGNMGNWGDSGQYPDAQQARWIAEEAIRQFEARGDVAPAIMVQAYVFAGLANRFLGEGWCWGVVDGGPLFPGKEYFKRAETWFTKALAITSAADKWKYAALGGRASSRLWLEDFDGAIADAKQVPTSFAYFQEMDFSKGGDTGTRNHIMWGNASAPYRSWTVNFTIFKDYYTQTGDPRTPWQDFPAVSDRLCVGSLSGYGRVPCTQQTKYLTQDDDIRLVSGPEMRLVEAEALLAKGDANWPAAMALINALRISYKSNLTGRPQLSPYTVTNSTEAWAALKRERGIELWQEGRRYADLRRWQPLFGPNHTTQAWPKGGVGGPEGDPSLPDFASVMTNKTNNLFTQNQRGRPHGSLTSWADNGEVYPRELCYNVSANERTTNPNLASDTDEQP
jgi:starch-binding outer membrane protein, SusD/RagB family